MHIMFKKIEKHNFEKKKKKKRNVTLRMTT